MGPVVGIARNVRSGRPGGLDATGHPVEGEEARGGDLPVRLVDELDARCEGEICGASGCSRGAIRAMCPGYIWPSLRRVSIPRPSSCARPARSAVVVVRNSVMICGIEPAQEFTVPVRGTQPRLR
jgi:hypothetical protein